MRLHEESVGVEDGEPVDDVGANVGVNMLRVKLALASLKSKHEGMTVPWDCEA